jgi:ABC-type antimicrobial peptide transport system permease subunit
LIFGLSDKLGISILGFPFGFGLFTAYCLCRLKFPDIEDTKNLESEMMASFNYQSHSTKRWFIWLFSILFGVINVILLVLTTLF